QYVWGTGIPRHLHQNAEGQRVVDNGLTNIEDADIGPGQNTGNGRGQTGAIGAGNVDQDDFLQGSLQSEKGNRYSNRNARRITAAAFLHPWRIAILAVLCMPAPTTIEPYFESDQELLCQPLPARSCFTAQQAHFAARHPGAAGPGAARTGVPGAAVVRSVPAAA